MLTIFLTIEDDADRSLAEQLYLTYKDRMYRIAFSVLHNKEDAEDAVMDAVINIVKHISMFRGNNRNKTESLIVIIIRNVSINRYHYNEHRTTADINEFVDSIPDDTNPADSIIESEDYETLLEYYLANKHADSEWCVLPITNIEAYLGSSSLSKSYVLLLSGKVLERKGGTSNVCVARFCLEE